MRWVVLGGSGLLGGDLVRLLKEVDAVHEVSSPTREELDITEKQKVAALIRSLNPQVLVNCAAWTDVDGAESAGGIPLKINGGGPMTLAQCMSSLESGLLVQVSTDYVFTDSGHGPHAEGSPTNPSSVYGSSKLAGEVAVRSELTDRSLVVRTAWLYGGHGRSFVKTVARKALAGEPLKVVNDQVGQPSWSVDVAARVVGLVNGFQLGTVPAGTYHAVNEGSATWYEFAREIVRLLDQDPELVIPISSDQLDRAARRPRDSRLGDTAAQACGLPPMRDWREALAEALPDIVRNL